MTKKINPFDLDFWTTCQLGYEVPMPDVDELFEANQGHYTRALGQANAIKGAITNALRMAMSLARRAEECPAHLSGHAAPFAQKLEKSLGFPCILAERLLLDSKEAPASVSVKVRE